LDTDVSSWFSSPVPKFYIANLKTRGFLGDLGINGRITLDIEEVWRADLDWLQWQSVLNTVMSDPLESINGEICLVS